MTNDEMASAWEAAKLLGIGEGETIDQKTLRRAYNKFAHEWHPDLVSQRGMTEEAATEMMAKGNAAHAVLKKTIERYGGTYTVEAVVAEPEPEPTYDPAPDYDRNYGASEDNPWSDPWSEWWSAYEDSTNGAGGDARQQPGRSDTHSRRTTTQNEASQSVPTDYTNYTTTSSSGSGKSVWSWFVIISSLIALALWNNYAPREAFEFAVGVLFNPTKFLIYLAIVFFPYLIPRWW